VKFLLLLCAWLATASTAALLLVAWADRDTLRADFEGQPISPLVTLEPPPPEPPQIIYLPTPRKALPASCLTTEQTVVTADCIKWRHHPRCDNGHSCWEFVAAHACADAAPLAQEPQP
jgi:hypothetical protein